MHEYDVTLKSILTRVPGSVLAELTGFTIARWHNTDLPVVRHRRADLLGETADARLVHFELQSTNRADMALRMLEYSTAIKRKFRRYPEQLVLYVGNAPLRMTSRERGPGLEYECRFADMRELDAEPLLESRSLEDNVVAVLARLGDEREGVRRILARIAESRAHRRDAALGELMVLAGLRRLGPMIEREAEQMHILDDIMDHEVLGRERKRGIAMGLAEGQRRLLVRMMADRFGKVPASAKKAVSELSGQELEDLGVRLLHAASLKELLG